MSSQTHNLCMMGSLIVLSSLAAILSSGEGSLYGQMQVTSLTKQTANVVCSTVTNWKTVDVGPTQVISEETIVTRVDGGSDYSRRDVSSAGPDGFITNYTIKEGVNKNVISNVRFTLSGNVYDVQSSTVEGGVTNEKVAFHASRPRQSWKLYRDLAALKTGETITDSDLSSDKPHITEIVYTCKGSATTTKIDGSQVLARAFEFTRSDKSHGTVFLDAEFTPIRWEVTTDDSSVILFSSLNKDDVATSQVTADDQKLRAAFIDSAQILTEILYAINATGRYDVVEKTILSDLRLSEIPPALQPIAKRIIELCGQGKAALESASIITNDADGKTANLAFSTGAKIGGALAMEDPISAVWAVASGWSQYGEISAQKNAQVASVLRQLDYRIKADMYDLQIKVSENCKKYGVPEEELVTYDALSEIEKRMPDFAKDPSLVVAMQQRYPHYRKIVLLYCRCVYNYSGPNSDVLINDMLEKGFAALDTANSITKVDNDNINLACVLGGSLSMGQLLKELTPELAERSLKAMYSLAEFGLQNGGADLPAMRFLRGAANSRMLALGLEPFTKDDSTADIFFREAEDLSPTALVRALWVVNLQATNNAATVENMSSWIRFACAQGADPATFRQLCAFKMAKHGLEILEECLTPRYTWRIEWGTFNDDIVLTNTSIFPITNVSLGVTLTNRGTDMVVFRRDLKTNYIGAGGSYTWRNIMSISGGSDSTTTGKASLTCDQSSKP